MQDPRPHAVAHSGPRVESPRPASTREAPPDERTSPEIEDGVQLQQTRLLFRNGGISFLVVAVNASLLAAVNFALQPARGATWPWWCAVVLASGARYALVRRFPADADAAAARRWRRLFLVGLAVSSAIWGAAGPIFVLHAPEGARLFTGLVLAGMVSGAVAVLAPVRSAMRMLALSVVAPLGAVVLWQAESIVDYAFGITCIVYLFAVLASARYLTDMLEGSIRLGLSRRRMADDLAQARDTAEAALAERKLAEATLRASEERYRLILQHSPTGILHYNRDLEVTFCNNRAAQILQRPRETLLGLDMRSLKDQRVVPALRAALEGREASYEGEYRTSYAGAQIFVALSCAPLPAEAPGSAGAMAIFEDVTDRRRSENEIRSLAYFDPLTHLPNRRLLMDRLEHAMYSSQRSAELGALLMLDLDHFKSINDTQGHDVGDRLLVEVAQRLTACLRQEDTVSRIGGDEYVVLLESLGHEEPAAAAHAESVAEKIRAALQQPYVLGGSESEYFSTTSIGLTLFQGRDESPEVLLKQADVALYQAKDAGRNAIRFFSPAMQATIERRASLERALRRGLDKQEFRLHYQPQVNRDGDWIGAEALVRWWPEGQSPVLPGQFIPLAEESGLIVLIGQWVLDTACRQLRAWERDAATRALRLSVNVSARQFHQPDFVDRVRQSLLASGADASRLILELTEGVVLDNVETVTRHMEQLRDLGVQFSLDDFGRGYSSLSYLKRLPLNQIKIDQSFVRDVPADSNDCAIVHAILAMSQSLGLEVVAEGVESREQREFLDRLGCHAFQGFLFSRPLPIEEFDALAARAPAQRPLAAVAARSG